jgi:ATP-binding cassette subfamily B protein
METTQLELAAFSEDVEESVSGIRVVKAFGYEPEVAGRAARHADEIRDVTVAAGSVRARYLPAFQALPTLAVVLALGAGGARVISGTASLGDLVAFNTYVLMLVQPLVLVGMVMAQYQRAHTCAERVCEVLAEEPEVSSVPGAGGLPPGPGAVEFRDVTFAYPGRPPILCGFDLRIEPGRTVALVGPTGSGKTTVAKLLARFHDVGSGSVLIDGVDVRAVDLDSLRRAVAIVFEDTFLFTGTVAENVSFGRPGASQSEIEWATSAAGADEFVAGFEEGYDTRVGEQGYTLSGGQRQRLAIARALLAGPRVLVLDDATSAVDAETEVLIRESLREITGGCTTLVIARRPQTVALADEVMLLDEGRIVLRGTHADLLGTDDRYARLLGTEART